MEGHPPMKIHRILATTAAASSLLMLVAACGTSQGSTSPSNSASSTGGGTSTITLGLVQSQDFVHAMPARVAEAQGLFSKAGLDVTIVDFHAGSDLTKAMAGGSVNVGAATGFDAVSAAAHGVSLPAFYGVMQKSPMALIVPKNSTIQSFSNLSGKRVGISAAGSLTDYTLRAALKAVNVQLSSVKEVPLGAPASTMAAMARGDIDAFILPVNFGYVEEAKGTGKIAQVVGDVLGDNDQFALLMADQSFVSANQGTLKKLAQVYTDAITWMKDNKDATVQLAVSKLGMPEPIAVQTYDELMGSFTPNGALNAAGMATYAQALPELGISTTAPSPDTYMTTAIVSGS
jgi:NitT/TauT family transport system substrate-binding protein